VASRVGGADQQIRPTHFLRLAILTSYPERHIDLGKERLTQVLVANVSDHPYRLEVQTEIAIEDDIKRPPDGALSVEVSIGEGLVHESAAGLRVLRKKVPAVNQRNLQRIDPSRRNAPHVRDYAVRWKAVDRYEIVPVATTEKRRVTHADCFDALSMPQLFQQLVPIRKRLRPLCDGVHDQDPGRIRWIHARGARRLYQTDQPRTAPENKMPPAARSVRASIFCVREDLLLL
jgi:hypothetical protein